MFRDIVEPSVRVGSTKALVLPLSIVTHVAVVGAALILSLLLPGVLPLPAQALKAFVIGDIALPPEPPPAARAPRAQTSSIRDVHADAAPLEAPSGIAPEAVALPVAPEGTVQGIANLATTMPQVAVSLPAEPPPATAEAQRPFTVGGEIKPPVKIRDVRPAYPAIALSAHIEGVVIIETTIGTTGRVVDAKVLRSVPLLDQAALEAVRQWEFTPTLLNGVPVAVVMTVTVNFSLK
jgi:protein TonB